MPSKTRPGVGIACGSKTCPDPCSVPTSSPPRASLVQSANWTRYQPGQRAGHYESFFQRANHPTRPLAFWIRYTIFSPAGQPEAALGELWAILGLIKTQG